MTQSYSATGVKTNMAFSEPDFSGKLFNTFNSTHLFTILSNNNGIINWTDEGTFEGEGEGLPGKVTIYGIGFERKVANKIFYDLNGSGIQIIRGKGTNGASIEFFYSVYITAVGELCKSGNIKFNKFDSNATTIKALSNGIKFDFNATYASNSEFCAKRLIK
jgi:hypothetical protein